MRFIKYLKLNEAEKNLRVKVMDGGTVIQSDANEHYIGKEISGPNLEVCDVDVAIIDFLNHRIFDNESIKTIWIRETDATDYMEIDDEIINTIFDYVDDVKAFTMYIDNGNGVYEITAEDLDKG